MDRNPRSGDPRKRVAQDPRPAIGPRGRLRLLIAVLIVGVGLVALSALTLRSPGGEPDQDGVGHAEAACSLTSKADEAAQVDTGARYAAAVLLLDNAIIESTREA